MKKFQIDIQYVETGHIVVEAETAEQAYKMAQSPENIAIVDGGSKEMKPDTWEVASYFEEIQDITKEEL